MLLSSLSIAQDLAAEMIAGAVATERARKGPELLADAPPEKQLTRSMSKHLVMRSQPP